jgi:GATA-binding protein
MSRILLLHARLSYHIWQLTTWQSNCGTSKTPLWRRSVQGATICNACGLYSKARNTSRPMTLKKSAATSAALPDHDDAERTSPSAQQAALDMPVNDCNGSCPGGGHCNGTGGAEGCNGCPAYNNRLAKKAQPAAPLKMPAQDIPQESGERAPRSTKADSPTPASPDTISTQGNGGDLSCKNCATTVTPLWRRDESGHTICNACGMS